MRTALAASSPERHIVHRQFTVRWTRACVFTQLHGELCDQAEGRAAIANWSAVLREAVAQVGDRFVSVVDASNLGEVPRPLWLELAQLVHRLPRQPERRAVLIAEGARGDNQAQAIQLATAGHARFFATVDLLLATSWLAEAQVIDERRLLEFLA